MNTIPSWVRQLEETGSTLREDSHGRGKCIRTPENVQQVRAAVQQLPRRSDRRHAVFRGIWDRSLRWILHYDFNFHPFKIVIAHELSPLRQPLNSLSKCLRRSLRRQLSAVTTRHIFTWVGLRINKIWVENSPRIIQERPLHSPKLTVWSAVSQFGVIGPYFFEEKGVTVNSGQYVSTLQNCLQSRMEDSWRRGIGGIVVPTGWSYGSHSPKFTPCLERNVSVMSSLFEGWCGVACA